MPSAYDLFLEWKPDAPSKEEAAAQSLHIARELIARIQQKTLSAIDDSIPRQIGGMLFSHTLKALDTIDIQGEPEVYEKAAMVKRGAGGLPFAILAALVSALAVYLLRQENLFFPLLCQIAALILWIAAFFLTRPGAKKTEYKIIPTLDFDKLMAFVGAQMRLIDQNIEALLGLCLTEDSQEISESALAALMKIYELQGQGDAENPEILQAITYYLKENGLSTVEYTAHNAPMFQALPTVSETRTLVPALLKNNRMVRQGLAIVKKEAAQ